MIRLPFLATALAISVLATGCGSTAPANLASQAEAASAVAEAQRAVDRAGADPAQQPYLDEPRRDAREAAVLLAAGETDEALHRAYLARQGARLAALQAEIDAAEASEQDAEGGGRILITDAFQTGRITLRPESRQAVDQVAAYLESNPDRVVLVESFTDATGNAERNLDLSIRRAEAVKARMVEAGVAEDRVVTVGYGQEYPVASNDTSEGQRQNRRIEISVAETIDGLPSR